MNGTVSVANNVPAIATQSQGALAVRSAEISSPLSLNGFSTAATPNLATLLLPTSSSNLQSTAEVGTGLSNVGIQSGYVAQTSTAGMNLNGNVSMFDDGAQSHEEFIEGQIWMTGERISSVAQSTDSGKNLVVEDGNVLFVTNADTTVETPLGSVNLSAHSVVLVMSNHNRLAVFDMDDSHPNSVVVRRGHETVSLSPGKQMVVVEGKSNDFAIANPSEIIGYRRVTGRQFGDTGAFVSDFSIGSAICAVKPLKQLVTSNRSEHLHAAAHLAKTAGILIQLDGSSLPYQQIPRPRMTALK
jgi:hypothetical protein